MNREEIKTLALECGFKLKKQEDGEMDLNEYVYTFAKKVEDTLFNRMAKRNPYERGEVKLSECRLCDHLKEHGFGPSHNGSKFCKSGSIASGGTKSHCTCDVCF